MNRLTLSLVVLFLLVCDASAANRFLTCPTTCTITASDTTIWGTTTGGTGASVPGSSDAVILDGATCVGGTTCTATMGAGYNPTWQSITFGACTASTAGCIFDWSVNNNSLTLTATGGFSGTGSGTRNLKMGSGTLTLTAASGTVWNFATTTNLTFSGASATINLNATATASRTFSGGGLSYGTLTLSADSGKKIVSLVGANTFATFNLSGPGGVAFGGGVTTTITNAFAITGTSSNNIGFMSGTPTTTSTISIASGTATLVWASIAGLAFTGGATFTATSSIDGGNNTGITITAPTSGGGPNIIGGWLLESDLPTNDNFMVLWEVAA